MRKMRTLLETAQEWLEGKDRMYWSKAHFFTKKKSNMLLNYFSKSFNKYILEARGRYVLFIMEVIRTKLMQRIAIKREEDGK